VKICGVLFALVISAGPAAPAYAQTTDTRPVIVTTGEGIVERAPDRAWVTIGAETRARTAEEAQQTNATAMAAVIDKIKAASISADAIQTSGVTLQPEFDYPNGKQALRDYVARNSVQVRVDALDKAGAIISAAVGTGATNVSGVRFDLKDRDKAERDALTLAVRDARTRADAAATGAGLQVAGVIKIEEQREPTAMPMMRMAAVGGGRGGGMAVDTPIEAGEIEIRAHVTLTVGIK
jgi:uncharacterized protein YggE